MRVPLPHSPAAAAWCTALAAVLAVSAGCHRPIFDKEQPLIEKRNPAVPAGQYDALTTIAGGGDSRIDFQVSATVRSQLDDSGFTVVRRAGRWNDERAAVRAICAPDAVPSVDGVVFVWYDRLELRDCGSEVVAYEVNGGGHHGITEMTDRLIRYLRRPPARQAEASR